MAKSFHRFHWSNILAYWHLLFCWKDKSFVKNYSRQLLKSYLCLFVTANESSWLTTHAYPGRVCQIFIIEISCLAASSALPFYFSSKILFYVEIVQLCLEWIYVLMVSAASNFGIIFFGLLPINTIAEVSQIL